MACPVLPKVSEPFTSDSKGHSVPVVPSMPAEWRMGKGGTLRSKRELHPCLLLIGRALSIYAVSPWNGDRNGASHREGSAIFGVSLEVELCSWKVQHRLLNPEHMTIMRSH